MKRIILIAAILTGIAVIALFTFPISSKKFEIKDRCGKVGGTIMNTITEPSTCSSQCYSQCVAEGYKDHESQFEKGAVCNTCLCACSRTLL